METPKFLKKALIALRMREDSLAVLESGLGEAGLSDADMASLDPKQLEKLRTVVLKTEVGDAIAVFSDRVGTEFTPDERKILIRIAEIAVKRSGRLPELVATLRKEGENKQAAEIAGLKGQLSGQSHTMAEMQATLQDMQAFMVAQAKLQMQANAPVAPPPAQAPAVPPAPVAPPPPGA
ncbi:MAG: hypothetical protein WC988_00980 [Patescibacteria group bacterium]